MARIARSTPRPPHLHPDQPLLRTTYRQLRVEQWPHYARALREASPFGESRLPFVPHSGEAGNFQTKAGLCVLYLVSPALRLISVALRQIACEQDDSSQVRSLMSFPAYSDHCEAGLSMRSSSNLLTYRREGNVDFGCDVVCLSMVYTYGHFMRFWSCTTFTHKNGSLYPIVARIDHIRDTETATE